ncbi:unnamed protein product [Pylaiella littoralis]
MRFGGLFIFAVGAQGFFLGERPPTSFRLTWKNSRSRERISPPLLLLKHRPTSTAVVWDLEMAAAAAGAAAQNSRQRVGKLLAEKTVFFECDIQERFRDLIYNMPSVISTAKFLLEVSKELDVPCVATEQYPKALLHTVQELNIGEEPDKIDAKIFEKKLFSMCTDEVKTHVANGLPNGKPTDVVLFGIEAHVCVTQTCLDLLALDYGVHVVCDGVSSQKPHDRAVALERMQRAGAFLTTAEQVTFQLLGTADHTNFKAVSNLVKRRNKEGVNSFSAMSTL